MPSVAGLLVNQLREVATFIDNAPILEVSPDPDDDWLLGLAKTGDAGYIVSGDKRHVLKLIKYGSTSVITLSQMLKVLQR